jgi:hypothetical protein
MISWTKIWFAGWCRGMPRWIVFFSSKMKMKEKDEDEDSSWQGTRLFLLSLVSLCFLPLLAGTGLLGL